MAVTEDIRRRFIDEVKLRAYDDKYIDRAEEKEILKIAIEKGISIDSARSGLLQVCEQNGYVCESAIYDLIRNGAEAACGDDGKVDEKEFNMIVASAKRACQGKKNDTQIKRMVIETMEGGGLNKVKTGWFSDWYARVKKEVGMA